MRKLAREFRLVPIVLLAIGALFVLKVVGLVSEGGYILGAMRAPPSNFASPTTVRVASPSISLPEPLPEPTKRSWARQMLNFPDSADLAAQPDLADVTGSSVHAGNKDAANKDASKDPPAKDGADKSRVPETVPVKSGTVVPLDGPRTLSAAERAILERLQERRGELDARARELDVRESMLKAAEKRIEGRVNELKEIEGRIKGAEQKKDEAEAARFKSLVTMYENMKAKDAARIFDRLDLKILVDVTNQINPRRMADILAAMSSEAAERLTVELANRASLSEAPAPAPAELPKIEGRPSGS